MILSRRDLLLQGLSATAAGALPCSAATATVQRRIALTFDDVPRDRGAFLSTSERTQRLIAILRAEGVHQAAFFAVPGFIEEPGKANGTAHIAAYAAAGHVIGNHTWDHPRLSDISADEFVGNIARAESWLKGKPGYRPWFRFPYLDQAYASPAKSRKVSAYLQTVGLADAWVTVDGSDWAIESQTQLAVRRRERIDMAALRARYVRTMMGAAEFYDRLAVNVIGRSPAHVMLLHETDVAALYIGDFIRELRRGGWTIITADEAYADPLYRSLRMGPAKDFCAAGASCSNPARMADPLSTGPTVFELMAWAAGRRGAIRYTVPTR
ncbi:MAG: polysaccharide deacetylase-related protein [Novosphingobium sp.]|nr:polysaccharide deacetylase-related protein [Novosphingobium sp.]